MCMKKAVLATIILVVIGYFLAFFIIVRFGKKCMCYGVETDTKCIGVRTMCFGPVPLIPLPEKTAVSESNKPCNSTKTEDSLAVDFANCSACSETVYVGFGSTAYEVLGKKDSYCAIRYGGEVENPNWNGKLDTTCKVPTGFGTGVFKVTNYGVDFSAISDYCQK